MSTEREPLLSDEKIHFGEAGNNGPMDRYDVRAHYESLISQGKLREVKLVEYDLEEGCLGCGWPNDNIYPFSKCCPGCGNPIKH